VSVKNQLS